MLESRIKIVFDRKKNVKKTGLGKIEALVYFNRKSRRYITVGEGSPDNWKRIAESPVVNNKVIKIRKIINAMEVLDEDMTPENFNVHLIRIKASELLYPLPKLMYNGYDQNTSFPDYMENCIAKERIADGTRKHKMGVVRAIRAFGKLNHFYDLKPARILEFDEWLQSSNARSTATIYDDYHKKVRKYTKRLYDARMIPTDPYEGLRIPHGKYNERRPLSEDELKKIRDAKFTNEKLIKARDLFIFASYTGLSYCDVMAFDFKLHAEKYNGMYFIDGKRIKTSNNYYAPILPPAMDVLKKYNYKLPHISDQKANVSLHIIEALLHINKPITFHVARHTFATMVLSHDVPIENLARMLGHTDLRSTRIYAKILKKTIERYARKLRDELN